MSKKTSLSDVRDATKKLAFSNDILLKKLVDKTQQLSNNNLSFYPLITKVSVHTGGS